MEIIERKRDKEAGRKKKTTRRIEKQEEKGSSGWWANCPPSVQPADERRVWFGSVNPDFNF